MELLELKKRYIFWWIISALFFWNAIARFLLLADLNIGLVFLVIAGITFYFGYLRATGYEKQQEDLPEEKTSQSSVLWSHTCARCGKAVGKIMQNGLCTDCARLLMLHVEAAKDETMQALDTVKLITGSSMYSDATKERAVDLLSDAQEAVRKALDIYSSTYGPETETGIEGEYQHASLVCSQITRLISMTEAKPRPSVKASVVSTSLFPVAGVTYYNEDGSSRQEILCDLCDGDDEGEAEARLVAYKYKGSS